MGFSFRDKFRLLRGGCILLLGVNFVIFPLWGVEAMYFFFWSLSSR